MPGGGRDGRELEMIASHSLILGANCGADLQAVSSRGLRPGGRSGGSANRQA